MKLLKRFYNWFTETKSFHNYEIIPKHMEKYYEPIPKEQLCEPLPGDEEIHTACLVGITVCCLVLFFGYMPWGGFWVNLF
jgi:hypothetical protein